MQKLNFDLGIKEYEIGGGVLRFNPSDPNVYTRFMSAGEKLTQIEQQLTAKAKELEGKNAGEAMLQIMEQADKEMKELLDWVFGAKNDFNAIFCGTNVLAVGSNGERTITNFLHAIQPIMEKGAKNCARQQVNQAKMNRAQRRSAGKK